MSNLTVLDVLKWCWDRIKEFVSEVWFIWIALVVTIPTSLIIRDGNFSSFLVYDSAGKYLGLNQDRVLLVLGLAFLAAAFDFIKKQRAKKIQAQKMFLEIREARKELDSQYDYAFSYSSLSVFNLHAVANKGLQPTLRYVEKILDNITEVTRLILEANEIENGKMLTASLMVKQPKNELDLLKCTLKTYAFGPERPDRHALDLPFFNSKEDLDNANPLPGAPTAFCKERVEYIDNTKDEKYASAFPNAAYNSFISIPITENESDGAFFAVLNIDSININQFVDKGFFSVKIYPALKPIIALIKILHKFGQI